MILVCGYYFRHNLGDDAFLQVLQNWLPDHHCETIDNLGKLDHAKYSAIVIAGGDLINDYFFKNLVPVFRLFRQQGKKIFALGVGLPFLELIDQGYLDWFDHVFVRSLHDVRLCQARIGSTYAHYLPDLAFALDLPVAVPKIQGRIGIALIAALAKNTDSLDKLAQLFWKLAKRYQLVFFRFDSSGKPSEDDRFVNNLIQDRIFALYSKANPDQQKRHKPVIVNNSIYTPDQMLREFQRCEYAITMRFHSHVFATLTGVPFLSICETRKVQQLIAELGVDKYCCRPNDPADQMYQVFKSMANDPTLSQRLEEKAAHYKFLLETDQPRQLLHWSCRPGTSVQIQLDQECRQLAVEYHRLIAIHGPNKTAELLCWALTRNPHSKYLHGMRQNMQRTSLDQLCEMIKWVKLDQQRDRIQECSLDLDYICQEQRGLHRSGWQYCLDYLQVLQNPKGVICDTYLDRSFHWAKEFLVDQGLLPYTSPWIGFLHHTANEYSDYNAQALIECKEFQQSLDCCLLLICLSETLAAWLRARVNVKIVVLYHPTRFVSLSDQWTYKRFKTGRRLLHVGAWYRNPWTIHTLDLPSVCRSKAALQGKAMENYFAPKHYTLHYDGQWSASYCENDHQHHMCRDHKNKWLHYLLEWLNKQEWCLPRLDLDSDQPPKRKSLRRLWSMIHSVELIQHCSDQDYDQLLATSVVYLDLVDASACNTVIECIVRNVPVSINRLPAIEEYLGKDYPLYHPTPITKETLKSTWRYLINLDKSALRVSHFIDQLQAVCKANF